MPHSHTLAARVNAAWTISRPSCRRESACGGQWDHTQTAAAAAAAYQVSHSLVTWRYSDIHIVQGHCSAKPHTSCQVPRCHVHACCSCELDDTRTLSTHRSRVLVRRQFSLPAYTRVANFCHIFGRGNGGRLIRGTAYTRVDTVTFFSLLLQN